VLLAACGLTPAPASPTVGAPRVTASPTAPPTAAATLTSAPPALRVWLPPQFAPDQSSAGGVVLADQLAQFQQAHPEISIEVRLKEVSGAGGLLNTLVAAYNAAPAALPDLIALDRDDLDAAAEVGLLAPLDGLIPVETLEDYYPFAQAMGRWEGATMGLPFAADARVMAYRTDTYTAAPRAWADVITGTLILPAAEASGLTVLGEYLALGGAVADSAGQPRLDAAILADALGAFSALQASGWLPVSTLTYASPQETWQVFRERRATLALTSAEWYLRERERVLFSGAALTPASGGEQLALVEGWSWAVVNTSPERQARAVELLNWLAAPAQLAAWTRAAQVLPPREGAFAGWGTDPRAPFVAGVILHAQLQPSREVLAVVGPPLKTALEDVLNGEATPFSAAVTASEVVANP
jgi:ABC-type glycerol-3-phosphate transport system substrate-binding protein